MIRIIEPDELELAAAIPMAFFLTPQGLAATEPRAFGYDFDCKAALAAAWP